MKYKRSFRLTKNKKKRVKIFLSFFLISVFLGLLIYFLFFSDFFCLDNILVSGATKGIRDGVYLFAKAENQRKKLYFFNDNILLIDPKLIKQKSLKYFPSIEEIRVIKEYPDILKVLVREREEVAYTCFSEGCFLLDENGIVFEKISEEKSSLLKIEGDQLNEDFNLGEEIINSEFFSKILNFYSKLKDLELEVEKLVIVSEERVNVVTKEGWQIYFDPQKDIQWQFTKLEIVLKEHLSLEERKKLEYIELRFGNTAPVKKR